MIITLCGSARFEAWFHHWNELLSLTGHTVFSLGIYPSWKKGEKNWYSDEEKRVLDQVHISKIVNSDAILVLNPFAYLGDSTLNEITAAKVHGKKIYFLESWGEGCGICEAHNGAVRAAAYRHKVPEGFTSPIETHFYAKVWDLLGPAGKTRSNLVEKDRAFRREHAGLVEE